MLAILRFSLYSTSEIAGWEQVLGSASGTRQEDPSSDALSVTGLIVPDGEGVAGNTAKDQEAKISLYLKAMVNAGSETPISSPSTTNSESFFERFGAVCSLSDSGK